MEKNFVLQMLVKKQALFMVLFKCTVQENIVPLKKLLIISYRTRMTTDKTIERCLQTKQGSLCNTQTLQLNLKSSVI